MATPNELAGLAAKAVTMTALAVNDRTVLVGLAGLVSTLRQELIDSEGHLAGALRSLIPLDEQGNLRLLVLQAEGFVRGPYDNRIAQALNAKLAGIASLLIRASQAAQHAASSNRSLHANAANTQLPALSFPGEWRFARIAEIPALPEAVAAYFHEMLLRVSEATSDTWATIEAFKVMFGAPNKSSSLTWARIDLLELMRDREKNAVLTIVGVYDSIRYAESVQLPHPTLDQINEVLRRNGVGYRISPPDLLRVTDVVQDRVAQVTEIRATSAAKEKEMPDARKVFIIHGRNLHARAQIEQFVRSLDLFPLEFDELAADQGAAFVGDIVRAGLQQAQGIIAMFTSDEYAALRPEYRGPHDVGESAMRWQARPNVIFEAGMAYGMAPERTILLTLGGDVRLFSDVTGLHIIRLDNDRANRNALRQKLIGVGCAVNARSDAWSDPHRAGDFELSMTRLAGVAPRDPF